MSIPLTRIRDSDVYVCKSSGIEPTVTPDTIPMPDVGAARIAIWVALGATGWAALVSVVVLMARLVT